MSDNRPIGIFDSGIGGLTVARGIRNALPNEDLLYYGDTAHLPYGEKSPEAIKRYATEITRFLLSKGAKAIVIACNSASSVAAETVQQIAGDNFPVINVIDPMVELICNQYADKNVTVIGTKVTVGSKVYSDRVQVKCAQHKVTEVATPLLASMIEEGFVNDEVSLTVLKRYLSHKDITTADALVLGCTHYPVLEQDIHKAASKPLKLLLSPEVTAKALEAALKSNQLTANRSAKGDIHVFVSDYTTHFEKNAQAFFGDSVKLSVI